MGWSFWGARQFWSCAHWHSGAWKGLRYIFALRPFASLLFFFLIKERTSAHHERLHGSALAPFAGGHGLFKTCAKGNKKTVLFFLLDKSVSVFLCILHFSAPPDIKWVFYSSVENSKSNQIHSQQVIGAAVF